VRYEWDESKNRANLAKHGIRFEAAIGVFDDPDCVIEPSYDDPETGEERWLAIGFTPAYARELVVIHVYRYQEWRSQAEADWKAEEIIRILSARKANPSERRRLEKL
jgi:uncharacterized protein